MGKAKSSVVQLGVPASDSEEEEVLRIDGQHVDEAELLSDAEVFRLAAARAAMP